MAAVSRTAAPAIIAAYDFSKFGRIVDVGGANGALLAAIFAARLSKNGVLKNPTPHPPGCKAALLHHSIPTPASGIST